MPVEIVTKIQSVMSVADMVAYGAASHNNYVAMHNAIVRCMWCVISKFTRHHTAFMQMLTVYHAVISGSVALWVFQLSTEWTPNDMDVLNQSLAKHTTIRGLQSLALFD